LPSIRWDWCLAAFDPDHAYGSGGLRSRPNKPRVVGRSPTATPPRTSRRPTPRSPPGWPARHLPLIHPCGPAGPTSMIGLRKHFFFFSFFLDGPVPRRAHQGVRCRMGGLHGREPAAPARWPSARGAVRAGAWTGPARPDRSDTASIRASAPAAGSRSETIQQRRPALQHGPPADIPVADDPRTRSSGDCAPGGGGGGTHSAPGTMMCGTRPKTPDSSASSSGGTEPLSGCRDRTAHRGQAGSNRKNGPGQALWTTLRRPRLKPDRAACWAMACRLTGPRPADRTLRRRAKRAGPRRGSGRARHPGACLACQEPGRTRAETGRHRIFFFFFARGEVPRPA